MNTYCPDRDTLAKIMIKEFCEFAQIDAHSGHERAIADVAAAKLEQLGFSVTRDNAGSHFGGETGNVIGKLEGQSGRERIMICAHLDRVAPGNGIRPMVSGNRLISAGDTVLAADDIAGVVAALTGARLAMVKGVQLPTIEVVFTVSEECGLAGSKNLDYHAVGSKVSYVLDAARPVGTIVVASPTHVGIDVSINGRAAHAAINPEDGMSAIQIAAEAIARIPFGRIDQRTTANIGVISGGLATNIVCERVDLRGEVRSLDHTRALSLSEEFASIFKDEAERHGGSAEATISVHYPCYSIPASSPTVKRVQAALSNMGKESKLETSMGGSDANVFNQRGIESVCLGVGFEQVHSCRESIPLEELVDAAQLVCELILAEA